MDSPESTLQTTHSTTGLAVPSPAGSPQASLPSAVRVPSPAEPETSGKLGLWGRVRNIFDLSTCGSCPMGGACSGLHRPVRRSGILEGCPSQVKATSPAPKAGREPMPGQMLCACGEQPAADSASAPASTTSAAHAVQLASLQPGDCARICEINGVGVLRRRLLEMGVLPGTDLELERVAPLGDPIEVRLRGYRLSLRRAEAAHILVVPTDNSDNGE